MNQVSQFAVFHVNFSDTYFDIYIYGWKLFKLLTEEMTEQIIWDAGTDTNLQFSTALRPLFSGQTSPVKVNAICYPFHRK